MAATLGPSVAIVMGSDSDLKVMRAAAELLERFGINHRMQIVSAHRTPQRLYTFAAEAEDNGVGVIIAGAGGAAHLPGMVASISPLPVIGVPISATKLNGQDALLSIVQMPAGVPVATVAIDNAHNAAVLAAQILGVADAAVRQQVAAYKQTMAEQVEAKALALERAG